MLDPVSGIRPHWRHFLDGLNQMPGGEVEHAWQTAQRLIHENGVTYNVYEEAAAGTRPWRLDPVPLLIGAEEWRALEAGIVQRARLLNAVAGDLYGEQNLIRDGRIPPALAFENPNFLRPLHGVKLPGDTHLHFIAVDLARAADNKWWVLGDRTQAPSGAGYALENRVVMRRAVSSLYRNAPVQYLASFFQAFSDHLVAQTGTEDPLIVLLTPGPWNETYFEHAYLARYLGIPLVEGADLTVRDNKVYLKTLNGLRQVNLILRRIDADFCDPLELRTESLLGVAGLVAAVREGNVVVANSLGSAIVECEAMMSFLPGLCRHIFDEDLLLPSAATWWCGQGVEQRYVLDNLEKLVVRNTFSNRSIFGAQRGVMLPAQMSAEEREALAARIRARGRDFTAQEILPLSTAPTWQNGALQPSPMVLRVYVCADGDGYRVMPGGLTRISDFANAHAVSMQQGDASKDTWVLSDSPVNTFSRLAATDNMLVLRRSGSDLPSRVADNLFWLGRYAERTESTVRLMRSMVRRLAGETGALDDTAIMARLVRILSGLGYLNKRLARRRIAGGTAAMERELGNILFDRTQSQGLLGLLKNLNRTASLVRDRLSIDAWQILDAPRGVAARYESLAPLDVDDALAFLNEMLRLLAAFNGMQMENMTRSIGWRLLDVGRRIERCENTAKLIRELAVNGEPTEDGSLDLLLELGDSSMTYRTRYLATVQLPAVLDLLILDETNPRSLAFQLDALADHLSELPRERDLAVLPRQNYLVEDMRSAIRLSDVFELADRRDARGKRVQLDKFLMAQQDKAAALSNALAQNYFIHVMAVRTTAAAGPDR